ncbi:tol-pal system protein YbgF [Devosia sp.]|uniref:tol-pal system protein YbgF n=1 Tax=Devosia sp. TaxID=1871048 RepID=UPI003A8CC8C6
MAKAPIFRRPFRGSAIVLSLVAGLTAPAFAATATLPAYTSVAQGLQLPASVPAPRIHVAQNRDTAELMVRIQDLEAQIRTLTGQVEGLQFQLTQMQTLVERMQADSEFRFQQLEGGAPGKPQAAAPTDGAMPSETLPQDSLPAMDGDAAPMDFELGDSSDPLIGSGGGSADLGTLSSEDELTLDPSRPLDLSLGGGTVSNGDAVAQYDAGFDAMTRGDYAFAEEQFTQFIALYPDDPQAPDATNWLGEALIQRGAYTDAAQVLADGYTRYRDSRRAPDIMLKLGVALAGAEQTDVACRTFSTLAERYPDLTPAFNQRLAEESQKAQCPVG